MKNIGIRELDHLKQPDAGILTKQEGANMVILVIIDISKWVWIST